MNAQPHVLVWACFITELMRANLVHAVLVACFLRMVPWIVAVHHHKQHNTAGPYVGLLTVIAIDIANHSIEK